MVYIDKFDKEGVGSLLNEWFAKYNHITFIKDDPISIPHLFSKREDIEISGLFAALFSWGQRTTILKKSVQLMQMMDMQPHDFVMNAGRNELMRLGAFVHRTFNGSDCLTLVWALRSIYNRCEGLESLLSDSFNTGGAFRAIEHLREALLSVPHEKRTEKHLSSPARGSAAKRLNMYFRWMVRHDDSGIDFGIWNSISASELVCPLDVHTGRVARLLGLLNDKYDNWTSAVNLTNSLKEFDSDDPVKYDIALFCAGLYEMKAWKPI